MKKLIPILAAAALSVGADLSAQPHAGGILVGGGYPSNSTTYLNGLFEVNRSNGQMTTFVDTFTVKRPYYFQQTIMDRDNESVAFVTLGSNSSLYNMTFGLFRYDPNTSKYTTIARDPKDFSQLYGLTMGQDGDYYVSGYGLDLSNNPQERVYRVTNAGQWSTVLTTVQLGHRDNFRRSSVRDVDSGDVLIVGSSTVGFFTRLIYSISEDGSIGTWNMSSSGPAPAYGAVQEIATGDLVHMNGTSIYRTAKGRQATTQKRVTGLQRACYGCVFENQSMQNARLIAYGLSTSSTGTVAALEFIDAKTNTITKTVKFIDTNTRTQAPYPQRNALNANARYLQTTKVGNRTWDLNISAPAFAGKNYAIAASFSGVRPGVPISGRKIWLNVDALTPLVVDNRIPTVFNPGPLTLDQNGKAKGKINSRFMPASVRLNIHMILAVLDRSAPSGIAFISEPVPLRL